MVVKVLLPFLSVVADTQVCCSPAVYKRKQACSVVIRPEPSP